MKEAYLLYEINEIEQEQYLIGEFTTLEEAKEKGVAIVGTNGYYAILKKNKRHTSLELGRHTDSFY